MRKLLTIAAVATLASIAGCTLVAPDSSTSPSAFPHSAFPSAPDSPAAAQEPGERSSHLQGALLVMPSNPEEFLAAYGAAFVAGNYRQFAALHAPDFEYYADVGCHFQAGCAPFPWPRRVELRSLGNMMNPAYSGIWPPVQERRFTYFLSGATVLPGGDLDVRGWLTYTGMFDSQNGFQAGFEAELILHQDHDGSLIMRSLTENPVARAVPTCWGAYKCRYLP